MQQRAHPPRLQLFLHLPDAATRQGSKLGASSAAVSLVCACALVCALALAFAFAFTASAAPAASAVATGAVAPRAVAPGTVVPRAEASSTGVLKAVIPNAAGRCAGANLQPTAANAAAVDTATLCLVNGIRMAHQLHPLRANRELRRVAASQVSSMVHRDYFADDRPTGQTPLALVAVTHYPVHAAEFAVGESIAWGTGSFTTPAHIVAEWMASPPHREIILSTVYHDAGVAVTPAVPAILSASHHGATYAIELGMRLF